MFLAILMAMYVKASKPQLRPHLSPHLTAVLPKIIRTFLQLDEVAIIKETAIDAILATIFFTGFLSIFLFFAMKHYSIAQYIKTDKEGVAEIGKFKFFPHNHEILPGRWWVTNVEAAIKRKEEYEDPTKYTKYCCWHWPTREEFGRRRAARAEATGRKRMECEDLVCSS